MQAQLSEVSFQAFVVVIQAGKPRTKWPEALRDRVAGRRQLHGDRCTGKGGATGRQMQRKEMTKHEDKNKQAMQLLYNTATKKDD